ncbi:WD40-repeat-containing domain protein [Dimargaris cristalligena]|uniref:WD40-repeat-containing domain protein n=1 Tax=Dimargaris cristalligena TaxID=215637 RepID=A0A4P9ZW38_9FUNG|nr:WD40-repeat-containing domain protein [Dimargaris cristalligena]|eukprot:RKP37827.1 WD40-repeat-containing domain protein [Dimargaris cristalligena]
MSTHRGQQVSRPGPFYHLPEELLIQLFSHLPPRDLDKLQLVCRRWFYVINSETAWKAAFLRNFSKQTPFQRLSEKSWRLEYIKRVRLLRQWSSAKVRKIIVDPKMGPITNFQANLADDQLMVGSVHQGMVWRCDSQTGSVNRNATLFAHENEFAAPISAMTIESRRLAWGFPTGMIRVVQIHQASRQLNFKTFPAGHDSPVSQLCWSHGSSEDTLVSVCPDEHVLKLWDARTGVCLGTFNVPTDEWITETHYDARGSIVVASQRGRVSVWPIHTAPLRIDRVTPSTVTSPRANSVDELPGPAPLVANLPILIFAVGPAGSIVRMFPHWRLKTVYVWLNRAPWLQAYSLETGQELLTFRESLDAPTSVPPITSTSVHWVNRPRDDQVPKIDNPSENHAISNFAILATGHIDGTVRLWTTKGKHRTYNGDSGLTAICPFRRFKAHDGPVTHLFIDSYKLVTVGIDGAIYAWDCLALEHMRTFSTKISRRRQRRLRQMAPEPAALGPMMAPFAETLANQLQDDPNLTLRLHISQVLSSIWELHRATPPTPLTPQAPYILESSPVYHPQWPWETWAEEGPWVDQLHVLDLYMGVVCGSQAFTWNLRDENSRQDLQEGLLDYEHEMREEQRERAAQQLIRAQHSIQGLSEEEQLSYAMLLSMESDAVASSAGVDEPPTAHSGQTDSDHRPATVSEPMAENLQGLSEQELLDYILMLSRDQT